MKHYSVFWKTIFFLTLIPVLGILAPASSADPHDNRKHIFNIEEFTIQNTSGVREIRIPEGVFIVADAIALPSDTTLTGNGEKTILEVSDNFYNPRFISNLDFSLGNKNITVSNVKIRFNKNYLPGSAPGIIRFENTRELKISGLILEIESRLYGIDLSGNIKNALVEQCKIDNTGSGGGIMVRNRLGLEEQAVESVVISNCEVNSVKDEPIAVFGWQGITKDIIVQKNLVRANNASFGITAYGIDKPDHLGKISNVSIIENTIHGGNHSCIGVKGGAQLVNLGRNNISGALKDGILIHPGGKDLPFSQSVVVSGNTISNMGRYGIYSSGRTVTIKENTINECNDAGVYSSEQNNTSADIFNNNILNTKQAIIIKGQQKGRVFENKFKNTNGILYLD